MCQYTSSDAYKNKIEIIKTLEEQKTDFERHGSRLWYMSLRTSLGTLSPIKTFLSPQNKLNNQQSHNEDSINEPTNNPSHLTEFNASTLNKSGSLSMPHSNMHSEQPTRNNIKNFSHHSKGLKLDHLQVDDKLMVFI